jgi:hypothetical protein
MTPTIKTSLWARATSRIVGKEKLIFLTLKKKGHSRVVRREVSDLDDIAN